MTNYYNADGGNECLDLRGTVCPAFAKLRGTVCPHVKIYGVLFVRVFKSTVFYLSACANRRGTISPHVQK